MVFTCSHLPSRFLGPPVLPYCRCFLGFLVHQLLPHWLVLQGDVIDGVERSHSTDELVFQLKVRKADVEQIYLPQLD